MDPNSRAAEFGRPVNVKDALAYLDDVKIQFIDQPDVYNRFLDIMKEFKTQSIDTPGVIDRVTSLFRGHPKLITGFNTFLPPGYRIEATNNPLDPVRVILPTESNSISFIHSYPMVSTPNPPPPQPPQPLPTLPPQPMFREFKDPNFTPLPPMNVPAAPAPAPPMPVAPPIPQTPILPPPRPEASTSSVRRGPVEFNHAINYVNKIKNRFSQEPETYKQFLEILQMYQKEHKPIQEVYSQVQIIFRNAPDLLDEFRQFLPDTGSAPPRNVPVLGTMPNGMAIPHIQAGPPPSRMPPVGQFVPFPETTGSKRPIIPPTYQNKKAYKPSTPIIPSVPTISNGGSSLLGLLNQPQRKKAHLTPVVSPEKAELSEEVEFFDKVKKMIGNKATYNEFLKILNLYSQDIIDVKTLVERVAPFLDRSSDLLEWFKRLVKYEETSVLYNASAEKPDVDLKTCKKSGHSYRLLPDSVPRSQCQGRDSLCYEVLNDDWISHPVYVSETGFIAHKKNQFEEALYKCEEERYEFDRNIEANLHTIALLEPIAKKIQAMNTEERQKFKLPVGLGGISTSIYQRVIKLIYDIDRGIEVLDALHNCPAVAVPVVLRRLKQKNEEWRRSQREWNKIWREIDARNFYKSLDHQGINFKTSDRKSMNPKSLIQEIEVLHKEQKQRNSSANRYQFDFSFKYKDVFQAVNKILIKAIENNTTVNQLEEQKIKTELLPFLKKMFSLPQNFLEFEPDSDDEEDDEEDGSSSEKSEKLSTMKSIVGTLDASDKEAPNKGEKKSKALTQAGKLKALSEQQDQPFTKVSQQSSAFNTLTERNTLAFYSNSAFYIFFRLYQMTYARLLRMKEISVDLALHPPRVKKLNPVAVELGLQNTDETPNFNEADRYSDLVHHIYRFINGKIDASDFEDKARSMFSTSAYLIYTIDKLAQNAVKQMAAIVSDPRCIELLTLFYVDSEKATTSPRQEAMYRLSAEGHIDENMYRLEYFVAEKVLTLQLLGKEENMLDDSITPEEKWSLYVDHFVQLSTAEGIRYKRREPFLKRNLPSNISEEPPTNVETRSGLELKICVNTYKIFFVDNTEDYFCRKDRCSGFPMDHEKSLEIRHKKFRKWLDQGWKKGETIEQNQLRMEETEAWLTSGGIMTQLNKSDTHDFQRYLF